MVDVELSPYTLISVTAFKRYDILLQLFTGVVKASLIQKYKFLFVVEIPNPYSLSSKSQTLS